MIGRGQLDSLFGPNISFFVARELNVGEDPAEGYKFPTGIEVPKETLYIQNQGIACIEAPMSLLGTSGVRVNNEIITVMERDAREGEENSK